MAAGAIPSCSAMTASTAAATAGVDGNRHLEGEDITVYQYKICPFCNKLKVVMDFLGIPYSVTEVKSNAFAANTHARCELLWPLQGGDGPRVTVLRALQNNRSSPRVSCALERPVASEPECTRWRGNRMIGFVHAACTARIR